LRKKGLADYVTIREDCLIVPVMNNLFFSGKSVKPQQNGSGIFKLFWRSRNGAETQ